MKPRNFGIGTLIIGLLMAGFIAASPSGTTDDEAAPQEVRLLQNAEKEFAEAGSSCKPIVLMVSQFACPYCATLKKAVMNPMIRSGEFDDKVLIRELLVDPGEMLVDIDGSAIPAITFANRYIDGLVTPTVLLLDARGNQLLEPIVGISNLDFYGSYLESAIDDAYRRLALDCESTDKG